MANINLFLTLTCILTACQFGTIENQPLLTFEILSPGGVEETYLITIKQDHIYNMVYGTRDPSSKKQIKFLQVVEDKKRKISDDEWKSLVSRISKVQKMNRGKNQPIIKDSWLIVIKTKTNQFEVYYSNIEREPVELRDLVKEVIEISPVSINLHGWA